jgi:hypothetical protein
MSMVVLTLSNWRINMCKPCDTGMCDESRCDTPNCLDENLFKFDIYDIHNPYGIGDVTGDGNYPDSMSGIQ